MRNLKIIIALLLLFPLFGCATLQPVISNLRCGTGIDSNDHVIGASDHFNNINTLYVSGTGSGMIVDHFYIHFFINGLYKNTNVILSGGDFFSSISTSETYLAPGEYYIKINGSTSLESPWNGGEITVTVSRESI
jgi:hypothetical protein